MNIDGDSAVRLGQNVTLSGDTILGQHVRIGNNVTCYPGVVIGDRCTIFDGAVLGRPPMTAGNTTRPIDPTCRSLIIGDDTVIGANAVLYTGIKIGAKVLIGDLASIREGCVLSDQVVIGRSVLIMYDTRIGERSRIIDGAILTGAMIVESDVFIGPGVNSINDNQVYLKRFGLEPFSVQGPVIRRFALIGAGANLAAGIEVGMGAVVAPNAMVTHHVPGWTIVAGIPAKPIQMVDPAHRKQILDHFGIKDSVEAGDL